MYCSHKLFPIPVMQCSVDMICSLWFKPISICAFILMFHDLCLKTQPQTMAALSSSAGMDASEETNSRSQEIPESDIPKYASLLQVQNVTKKYKAFLKKNVCILSYCMFQPLNLSLITSASRAKFTTLYSSNNTLSMAKHCLLHALLLW